MSGSIKRRLVSNVSSNDRKRLAMGIAMGAQFIGTFVGGILMGHVFDNHFSTDPMGLFAGVSIGLTIGIILLLKSESKLRNDDK